MTGVQTCALPISVTESIFLTLITEERKRATEEHSSDRESEDHSFVFSSPSEKQMKSLASVISKENSSEECSSPKNTSNDIDNDIDIERIVPFTDSVLTISSPKRLHTVSSSSSLSSLGNLPSLGGGIKVQGPSGVGTHDEASELLKKEHDNDLDDLYGTYVLTVQDPY